jgi:SOS response regulatory protein OraA/RecX
MTALEFLLGRYVSLRSRSEQEIRRYIEQKRKKIAVSDVFVESLISRYKDLGCIDDKKFSEVLSHSLITNKAKGSRVLAMRLKMAGVEKELIQEALQQIPREDIFTAMAKRLSKHERKLSQLGSRERRMKSYSVLFAAGFSSSDIRAFLDEWAEKR